MYAVAFSYPVVPKGTARIRTQISAAHTPDDLDFAAEQFAAVGRGAGLNIQSLIGQLRRLQPLLKECTLNPSAETDRCQATKSTPSHHT